MSDVGIYSLRLALVIALLGVGSAIYAGVARRLDWTRVAERSVCVVAIAIAANASSRIATIRLCSGTDDG